MKKYNLLPILIFFSFIFQSTAQQGNVLMKINGKNISTNEFENLYTKNLELVQDPKQRDIDYYKNLFIAFKLELEDAYQHHYDTVFSFKKELKQYRDELAKKYLSDEEVINLLTKEAYNRMLQDVKVSHILIKLPRNPSPKDTLKAYHRAIEIYNKAEAGEDFSLLAKKYSQDPSAMSNSGDLGYINVFHTVYPFETKAYNTENGKISKPFRTKFGYHILKVKDKRKARGQIEVSHIFLRINKNNHEATKKQINQLYQKLINKEDRFENLAHKYSEDKTSARAGGRLRKFGIQEMIPEFEDQAFSLKNPGDISKPFESRYGWHIIKLIKKYPVPEFSLIQNDLRKKISRDERSKLGEEKLFKKILGIYNIEKKTPLAKIIPLIDKSFFENQWKIPQKHLNDKPLFIINNDQIVSVNDFYKFLYKNQKKTPAQVSQKKEILQKLYEDFKKQKILSYYNRHLENIYPEFANTVKEYEEGLLLFNIKSDRVWNKALQDTTGLKKFYNTHKEKYRIPDQYLVIIGQTNSKKTGKKLEKLFKQNKSFKEIQEKFKEQNLILQKKKLSKKNSLIKSLQLNTKKTVRYKDGKEYIIVHLLEIEKSKIPELEDIKGKVINDYQSFLENKWIEELKSEYPVIINEKNWRNLREKYKQ